MIRSKNSFKPADMSSTAGFGDTDNKNVVDGAVVMSAASDKYTFAAQDAANPLNVPSPFVNVPDVVEGAET